jgi:hypothetical protein
VNFGYPFGVRVSVRVSGIRGFGFGDRFPPESVFDSGSGFNFEYPRVWFLVMDFHPNRFSVRVRVLISGFGFGCTTTDPNPIRSPSLASIPIGRHITQAARPPPPRGPVD